MTPHHVPMVGVFTAQFKRILKDAGVAAMHTAHRAPDMNAIAERWVLSVKSECLDRIILFGRPYLERTLSEFVSHYNLKRPHQSLGNELITPAPADDATAGEIGESERLGGLLRSYHRVA